MLVGVIIVVLGVVGGDDICEDIAGLDVVKGEDVVMVGVLGSEDRSRSRSRSRTPIVQGLMREAFLRRSEPSFQLQSPEPTSGEAMVELEEEIAVIGEAAGEEGWMRWSSFRARPPTRSRRTTRRWPSSWSSKPITAMRWPFRQRRQPLWPFSLRILPMATRRR